MANYDRKEAAKQEKAREEGTGAGLLGIAALLLGGAAAYNKSQNMKQGYRDRAFALQRQIDKIDNQILVYENKLFGKALYEQEINELKAKRNKYVQELDENNKKL